MKEYDYGSGICRFVFNCYIVGSFWDRPKFWRTIAQKEINQGDIPALPG
jgi:hypothetical protein